MGYSLGIEGECSTERLRGARVICNEDTRNPIISRHLISNARNDSMREMSINVSPISESFYFYFGHHQ